MTEFFTLSFSITAVTGLAVGGLVGAIYFTHLRGVAERFVAGASPLSAAGGAILRIGLTLAVFVALMRWSPVAALAGLAGLTLARQWVIAWTRASES